MEKATPQRSTTKAGAGLRDSMPETAAWIDRLREAFGRELIDRQIRAGMRGEPVFHAVENGRSVGTPCD